MAGKSARALEPSVRGRKELDRLRESVSAVKAIEVDDAALGVLQNLCDELAQFLVVVRQRRASQAARKESEDRIRKAIGALFTDLGEELEFHGVALVEVKAFNEKSEIDAALASSVEQAVEQLSALLREHQALRVTSPSSAKEMREVRTRMEALEREVQQWVEIVVGLVGPLPSLPPPPPSPSTPAAHSLEETGAAAARGEGQEASTAEPIEAQSSAEAEAAVCSQAETHATPPDTVRTGTAEAVDVGAPAFTREQNCFWEECVPRLDFARAYWISRFSEEIGQVGLLPPSWVVKACVLAPLARQLGDGATDELYRLYSDHPTAVSDLGRDWPAAGRDDIALVLLLASLIPALGVPASGALGWLQEAAATAQTMQAFLAELIRLAGTGRPLNLTAFRDDSLKQMGVEQRRECASRAREWATRARASRTVCRLGDATLRALASPDNRIGRAVAAVIEDNVSEFPLVASVVFRDLAPGKRRDQTVDELALKVPIGPKVSRLVGTARDQVMSYAADLHAIMVGWVRSIQIHGDDRRSTFGKADHTTEVRKQVLEAWETGRQQLEALCTNVNQAMTTRTLAAALQSLVKFALGDFHQIEDASPLISALSGADLDWQRELRKPLLVLDRPPLDDDASTGGDARPTCGQWLGQVCVLDHNETSCLLEAFGRHLEAWDFAAARLVLEELEPSLPSFDYKSRAAQLDEARLRASELVRESVANLRTQVVRETLGHVLPEEERAELDGRLLACESTPTDRAFVLRHDLACIASQIDEERRKKCEALREVIKEHAESGRLDEKGQGWVLKAQQALDAGDLVLADEYVTLGEQVMNAKAAEGSTGSTEKVLGPNSFERFRSVVPDLMRLMVRDDGLATIRQKLISGESVCGIDMRMVPGARLPEIRQGIEAFNKIKRQEHAQSRDPAVCGSALHSLLGYFGFRDPKVATVTAADSYAVFSARMSDGGLSPVPDYGSARNSYYDVVVVWDRPSVSTIWQVLEITGLSRSRPLIIYPARMTELQCKEWAQLCHRKRKTCIVVDELLVYFLAGCRESRLATFFECTLPWTYLDPYMPQGGSVPAEMFKGRDWFIAMIEDVGKASSIMFGGRQLGKSAILRTVERQFHQPSRSQYVCFLDIRPLGRDKPITDLWVMLREWLIKEGLILPETADTEQALMSSLREQFKREPRLRVLLLLDEADRLIQNDAESEFTVLQAFRTLMDDTQRRFKVVLSGLHTVQRYYRYVNHPFAQMGEPLEVGPLEASAAKALIIEPLQALGFRFASEDAVYRILSYTNYHPALVQLFCSKLAQSRHAAPPYEISLDSVEQVYMDSDVRRAMRDRFEWTVGLDDRYQALVYSMIVEQMREPNGYRKQFTGGEALELASSWWEKGFPGSRDEDARWLLDELVGLGVLVRLDNGKYRLRNANVVRALGSRQEIEEKLFRIAESSPVEPCRPERLHAYLDRTRGTRSPLTSHQEGRLLTQETGVCLVFGSKALGLDALDESLKRFHRWASDKSGVRTTIRPVPPDVFGVKALEVFLSNLIGAQAEGRILVTCDASLLPSWGPFDRVVADIIEKVRERRRARNRALRLIIEFGPAATHKWMASPSSAQLERSTEVIVCRRWSKEMIESFLGDENMLSGQSVIDTVIQATGGWPFLTRHLLSLLKNEHDSLDNLDPRPEAGRVSEELANAASELSVAFEDALGLGTLTGAKSVLKSLIDLEPRSPEDLSAEMIEGVNLSEPRLAAILQTLERLGFLEQGPRKLAVEPVVRKVVTRL